MKFILTKEVLNSVMNKIGKILSSKTSVPILQGVLVQATKKYIGFTASNGHESIIIQQLCEGDVKVLEEGAAVLPKDVFILTKKLKSGAIDFSSNESCTQIEVKQNKTKINFLVESATQYPSPTLNEKPTGQFRIPAKAFEEIIDTTAFAVAKTESRPVLTGINLTLSLDEHNSGLVFKAVATDSHRLGQIRSLTDVKESAVTLTVPASALVHAVKSFELSGDVAIVTYNNQLALVNGKTIMYTRLLEGNYPDTTHLIPSSDNYLIISRDELIDALELISAMQNSSVAHMTVNSNGILLESKVETSRTQQEIQVIQNNNVEDGFKMAFSCEFTLDSLRTIHTKNVRMELSGSMRPFVFKNQYEDEKTVSTDALQLILPIRMTN